MILDELQTLIQLPDFQIQRRWHGVYAKHPSQPVWIDTPWEGLQVVTGLGGAGMTLSFGIAEQMWHASDSPVVS